MKLLDVIALRPQANDAASIHAAIAKAEVARTAAINRADTLERKMRAALLTASEEEMEKAEREAADAKRTADRIGALLGEMRQALAQAQKHQVLARGITDRMRRWA